MTDRIGKMLKFIARLLVALGLLAWVFTRVDLETFYETVRATEWRYLVGVWVSTVLFLGIQSMVLQRILRKQHCDVSLMQLFGASSVTALYSLILPGLLSTGVKWYILKKHTGKGSHVLSSMLYNQVMLSVTMTVIGLVGLIVTNPTPYLFPHARLQWVLPILCAAVLALIVLMFVLLLNDRTGGIMTRLLAGVLKPLPQGLQEKGQRILGQLAVFQTAGLRFHLGIVGLNLLDGVGVGLLIYLSAARAAHVTVGLGVLIWLCAIVYVLGKVPVSVANLGVREVTLVGLLGAYGVAKPAALLMSMTLFSAVLFMAALGGLCQLVWMTRSGAGTRSSAGGL